MPSATNYGETPLATAAAVDWSRDIGTAVRTLLAAGADPTIADIDGVTPLERAQEVLADVVRVSLPRGVGLVTSKTAVVTALARAEAWWRRRHALLAIRGRYSTASVGAAGSAAAVADAFTASGPVAGSTATL